ncbi:MAG TPA: hypothetical protein VLB02_00530 [Candidatus Paceibacterota bacterium]|nr:hypothetical protein [Candidatus Paceibacterota bacterium]
MYTTAYQEQLLREKQPAPKKKRWKKRKLFFILLVIALGIAGIIVLIRASFLQVRSVVVEGVNAADPGDVQARVEESLGGNYVFVIPKASIFFLSKDALVEMLTTEFPRFASVSIERRDFHTIAVRVHEYEEWALWCRSKAADDDCYFMDAAGTVFSPAPFFSGTAYLKVYKGELGEMPFEPLTPVELALLKRYKEELPSLRLVPTSVSFDSPYKLTVEFLYGDSTAQLFINPKHDPALVLENLSSALTSEEFKSAFRSAAKPLEYIDARFTNKVVYKFNE